MSLFAWNSAWLFAVSLAAVPVQAAQGLPVGGSALAAARLLRAPVPTLTKKGEYEGGEFWAEHEELFAQAWQELGPRHGALYEYGPEFERQYLHPDLRQAAAHVRATADESAARALFSEVLPGVFASDRLFSGAFLADLLQELEHIETSGIPRRRPNGMNRYGVILDQVGLGAPIAGIVDDYVRPLASMFFPELVGLGDADEHYTFTVRYEVGGDAELSKHGDASVVTLNLCLGRPGWTGGSLRFFEGNATGTYALPKGASAGAGDLTFQPGMALLHHGQHKHQALALLSGQRTNLILWLMGRHGVVRVAPYPPEEQLTARARWQSHRTDL